MSFLFARSSICTIMLWQEDSSRLAWWMFTTTPIFHAPVSDVSPLTLLRLKFQKRWGPNYCRNNGGPLGLNNICFCFCCCKCFHPWFCTLSFLCYWTGSYYCSVSYNRWRKTRACEVAPKRSPEALSMSVSVGAWLPVLFQDPVSFRFTVSVPGFIACRRAGGYYKRQGSR